MATVIEVDCAEVQVVSATRGEVRILMGYPQLQKLCDRAKTVDGKSLNTLTAWLHFNEVSLPIKRK